MLVVVVLEVTEKRRNMICLWMLISDVVLILLKIWLKVVLELIEVSLILIEVLLVVCKWWYWMNWSWCVPDIRIEVAIEATHIHSLLFIIYTLIDNFARLGP